MTIKKDIYRKVNVTLGGKTKEEYISAATVEELEKPETEAGKKAAMTRLNITKIHPGNFVSEETDGETGRVSEFVPYDGETETEATTAGTKETTPAKDQKPKTEATARTRRTKEQIEADAKAEADKKAAEDQAEADRLAATKKEPETENK